MKTAVWRGLDEPRMEIAYIESWERAHGTQIGVGYEVRWQLEGPTLRLEHVGGRRIELELGEADFFDVLASPFFNSLPAIEADIEFDADGFVTLYHDYLERIA